MRITDPATMLKICCSGFAKRVPNDVDLPKKFAKNPASITVQGGMLLPAASPAF